MRHIKLTLQKLLSEYLDLDSIDSTQLFKQDLYSVLGLSSMEYFSFCREIEDFYHFQSGQIGKYFPTTLEEFAILIKSNEAKRNKPYEYNEYID